jgi:uncharacterized membrane protein YdcZ (DUF606 family)
MSASNSPARYVLVLHFIVSLVFGVLLLAMARRFAGWVNWGHYDPTLAKMLGAALFGLSIGSLLAARDPLKHRVIVQMEIVYAFVASVAVLYRLVRYSSTTPHFAWVPFAVTTAFFVLFSLTYPRAVAEGAAAGEAPAAESAGAESPATEAPAAEPAETPAAEAPADEDISPGESVDESESQPDA